MYTSELYSAAKAIAKYLYGTSDILWGGWLPEAIVKPSSNGGSFGVFLTLGDNEGNFFISGNGGGNGMSRTGGIGGGGRGPRTSDANGQSTRQNIKANVTPYVLPQFKPPAQMPEIQLPVIVVTPELIALGIIGAILLPENWDAPRYHDEHIYTPPDCNQVYDINPTELDWTPGAQPAPGFEWRGDTLGSWFNPTTRERLRFDPAHGPYPDHFDYKDGQNKKWRLYPDGSLHAK